MWIILVVPQLKWRKRKRCGQFCDQGLKGDACKQLSKEVGASLRCLDFINHDSITAQQTKRDLDLVPKENRLVIGKCNGRIPRGLKPKEETFQVVLDALALTTYYPAFIIIADVPEVSLYGKTSALDKLRISRAQILWGMYHQKYVDYVELLWEDFTYQIDNKDFKKQEKIPEMKESKAYKTYLDYGTSVVPPKIARKFKKASPTKKDKPPVETKSKGKEKENMDVAHGKGIDLLFEVALTEKAQLKKVRKKSLRDFHKTHPSSSGTVAKKPSSIEKITPTVSSEGTSDKSGVPDVTEDDSTESESESWGNEKDNSNNKQEASDEGSGQENESEERESDSEQDEESNNDNQEEKEVDQENESEDDEIESDEDKGMDDTTDQFDDDVDARLEDPTQTGKEVVQGEGADIEMIDAQQRNENLETTQEQVVEDAHVTISTVTKKTEVPATSSSCSSDLASKFLIFLDIPHTDAEIVSPLDVHVHHEVPRNQAPTLLTIPVSVITESSHVYTKFPKSTQTFTPLPILTTPTPPPTIETTNPLSTLPDFASVGRNQRRIHEIPFRISHGKNQRASKRPAASEISTQGMSVQSEELVFEVADLDMPDDQEGNLGDNKDEPRNETASRRDWFKKPTPPQEPIDPDWNIGKTTQEGPTQNWLMTLAASTYTDKSLKDFDELMSTLIDFSRYILNGLKIENLTQEILLGPSFRLLKGTHSNYGKLEYDFKECYKALSEQLDWENPEGGDYPFDLSKPLPLIKRGKRQKVPFEFFINNDLKYLQGGISTMTYTTSTTKTKAAKYDLPGIEDMVPNIWSHVKVTYDKYALWGILHWRQQHKSLYAYARGMQSRGDVYSTKRILSVTHVKVMRKHRYGYLEEIIVRRADNILYRFKEGDDVADFAIALRMFTRSLVIQKRVEDLQLGVEGFIYVDDHKMNMLMRSNELYKFSDGTLTRLLSSLEDITKNINMEYLPKRRWSNLEKKRAHFMIKDINKLLKERRMMRSLEKFVGGRLYGTDLRLLQRTI
ncbi:hypothetical protein Tco_1213157 [Tanacetum coccineum]